MISLALLAAVAPAAQFDPPPVGAAGSGRPHNLCATHSRAYFAANDGTHGVELFFSDGTPGNAQLVSDLMLGSRGSHPDQITRASSFSDDVFFVAYDPAGGGRELFYYATGSAGPVLVSTDGGGGSIAGTTSSHPYEITPDRAGADRVFFTAWNGTERCLFVTDSTGACSQITGTGGVSDIAGAATQPEALRGPHWLTATPDGRLIFAAGTSLAFDAEVELWAYDPTPGSRSLEKVDLNHAPGAGSSPSRPVVLGGQLFCAATVDDDGTGTDLGRELAVVDMATLEVSYVDVADDPSVAGAESSDPSLLTPGLIGVAFTASTVTAGVRQRKLFVVDNLSLRELPAPTTELSALAELRGGFSEFYAVGPDTSAPGDNALYCVDDFGTSQVSGPFDVKNVTVVSPDSVFFGASDGEAKDVEAWSFDPTSGASAPLDAADAADPEPSFPSSVAVLPYGTFYASERRHDAGGDGRELRCFDGVSVSNTNIYTADSTFAPRAYLEPFSLGLGGVNVVSHLPMFLEGTLLTLNYPSVEFVEPLGPSHDLLFGIVQLDGGLAMFGDAAYLYSLQTIPALTQGLLSATLSIDEATIQSAGQAYLQATGMYFDPMGTDLSSRFKVRLATPLSIDVTNYPLSPGPADSTSPEALSKGSNDDRSHEYNVAVGVAGVDTGAVAGAAPGTTTMEPRYLALVRCVGDCTQDLVLLETFVLEGDVDTSMPLWIQGEIDLFTPMASQDGDSGEAHRVELLIIDQPPTQLLIQDPALVRLFGSYC